MTGDTTDINRAVFVSPLFPKSNESYGKCLKFKYKFVGPGATSLRIYQKMDYGYPRQPIWAQDASGGLSDIWHYAQTSISTISSFRVRKLVTVVT